MYKYGLFNCIPVLVSMFKPLAAMSVRSVIERQGRSNYDCFVVAVLSKTR